MPSGGTGVMPFPMAFVNFPVEGIHFSGTKGATEENGRFSPVAPLSLQAMFDDRKIVHFVVELVG